MEPCGIRNIATRCAASFRSRLQGALLDDQEAKIEETDILETQNARFNLWADNIGGAFLSTHLLTY